MGRLALTPFKGWRHRDVYDTDIHLFIFFPGLAGFPPEEQEEVHHWAVASFFFFKPHTYMYRLLYRVYRWYSDELFCLFRKIYEKRLNTYVLEKPLLQSAFQVEWRQWIWLFTKGEKTGPNCLFVLTAF